MSRTRHLTRAEADSNSRATRRRAKTRLTTRGDLYLPGGDRPKNAGNQWRSGHHAGQRRREEHRKAKVLGRRLDRRRQNREVP